MCYTDCVVKINQKEERNKMKTTMRLEVLKSGVGTVKNSDKYVVCFKVLEVVEGSFDRDHVNVFPEDWATESLMGKVVSGVLNVGGVYKLECVTKSYVRKDGSKSVGLKLVRPVK